MNCRTIVTPVVMFCLGADVLKPAERSTPRYIYKVAHLAQATEQEEGRC